MKALILHQSIINHDAIGNDIAQMYGQLKDGYDPFVYCDHLNIKSLRRIDKDLLATIIGDKSNLVIYHHSQLWEEGEEIIKMSAARVIFKYHNITPEHFFEGYDREAYLKCKRGREQTRRMIASHPGALWMGDSLFNLQDLEMVSPKQKVVVPPFSAVSQWRYVVPDEIKLKALLESPDVNLLFVGRVTPNKGHKFMFRVIRDYIDHYGPHIQLNIIGKNNGNHDPYCKELQTIIRRLNLKKNVQLIGEADERVMLAYYLGSDYFLCGSEHEGFCIPLIEAQYCHLPVIARKTSAIAETLGPDQLLLTEDTREYSSTIKVLSGNRVYEDYLVNRGYANYERRFTQTAISAVFKNAISEFTGASL
jgi:glycosyltransferase involved in cell wall biosynthesis